MLAKIITSSPSSITAPVPPAKGNSIGELVAARPARAHPGRLGIKKSGEFSNAKIGENYSATDSPSVLREKVQGTRRPAEWSLALHSGKTFTPSSSTCALRKASPSDAWRGFRPTSSASKSAKAPSSTCWTPPVTPSRARRGTSARVSCREPSCNPTRPASGPATELVAVGVPP